MAVDYFQYQVNKFWYRLYWAFLVVFTLLVIVLYILSHFITGFESYTDTFGLTYAAISLAAVNLIYLGLGFWLLTRYSLPFATLLGSMFFSLLVLNGLWQTDGTAGVYLYVVPWLISVFFSGIYGLPLLVGSVFITYVYMSMQSSFHLASISQSSLVVLAGSGIIAAVAYFFWKERFVSLETQQLNQLSGMVRSNQQQSAMLIQSIADGVIAINTEGKITLMNMSASLMVGWSIADATGVDASLVIKLSKEDGSEVGKEENPFNQVLTQMKHISQVAQVVSRDDNSKRTISLIISPVLLPPQGELAGAIAIMRDISQERAAEKQRAEFISTASHEMRTPVAAIEGYLELALNDKVSTIDSRAQSFLQKAQSSTQHLGKLFQDLLTSSKAEDGRLSSHPAPVEMGAFMQQLSDDLKFAAEKKGLLAEFVIGGADDTIDATTKDAAEQRLVKPLYYVNVDPDRMREVVTNLFDNACKYTDSGKITLGLTGNAEVVQIYIRDTGAGIPAEDIPHLFQKFYRVDNSATRTIGGTGLGLFICRKIVELYKGRIWVESQVGKGSTFFINLPRLSSGKVAELQASETTNPAAVAAAPASQTMPAASQTPSAAAPPAVTKS
jgi:PAS domain S-box-containing protein